MVMKLTRKENSIIERVISNQGEEAISYYKVLKRWNDMTMVEFTLETGRTHQLRVHSQYIGHPIVGDSLYSKKSELIDRQALHANKISFFHPITNEELNIIAPIPSDIKKLIEKVEF